MRLLDEPVVQNLLLNVFAYRVTFRECRVFEVRGTYVSYRVDVLRSEIFVCIAPNRLQRHRDDESDFRNIVYHPKVCRKP